MFARCARNPCYHLRRSSHNKWCRSIAFAPFCSSAAGPATATFSEENHEANKNNRTIVYYAGFVSKFVQTIPDRKMSNEELETICNQSKERINKSRILPYLFKQLRFHSDFFYINNERRCVRKGYLYEYCTATFHVMSKFVCF